jgi:4-oxalocrotonate tautomerase
MPFVTINIIEGRTAEQKRGMVKDVTDAIVKNIGCPATAVHIVITDMKRENIGQAGQLMSEIK